ncbi:restriction endonuclease subunit S [Erwinia endophytica]|uniref:restriction endonuclease subunit S n=1 Tax=Erwinia endophytica TaxID=1563158 RepID=UPI00186B8453|nr:restriction endonuclease subunit S [Erwinia endophytica]KAB8305886.1 restriction endonuclease subunit S [Erwinia endophytica]
MVPKLRFKNFEGIWEPKSLKDIACLTSSKRVHLSDYVKEGVPFFRGKEITELKSGIIPSDILYISPLLFNEFKVKHGTPRAGEILITAVGTLGNIYHINNIGDFYFKDGNLIWLRELKCNSLFLSFLLTFKKNEILNSAIGSTQKALTMVELNKLVFNYPRNDEQVKIASFLSLLEEKTSLLNKQYDLLCQYKKGIMKEIFSQKMRFKDDSGKAFPEWKSTILDEVVDLITNGLALDQNDSKNGYPVSRIETISERCINMKKVGFVDTDNDISNYKLNYGDMLFSNINSISHIGKIAYFDIDDTLYHGMNLLRIVIKNSHCKLFFYYQLTTDTNKKYFESRANQAISQASINQTELRKTPVQVPCKEEQTKIANFLSALDDKIVVKKAELDKLKTWKQGLLQQMFV